MLRILLLLLGLQLTAGCLERDPAGPGGALIEEADVRVLFIGNSLTEANRLADMTRAIAEAAGHELATGTLIRPGGNLEDLWNAGAPAIIREQRADVVVLQQGPSSLPENQVHLREWSVKLAAEVRAAGGEPALYMVWPSRDRLHAMDAVRDSYEGAAEAVDGYLIPAGEAWRAAWALEPDLPLYGSDQFHPSRLGSILVAMTIVRILLEVPMETLPDTMIAITPGLRPIELEPEVGAIFRSAVEEAVASYGRRPEG